MMHYMNFPQIHRENSKIRFREIIFVEFHHGKLDIDFAHFYLAQLKLEDEGVYTVDMNLDR